MTAYMDPIFTLISRTMDTALRSMADGHTVINNICEVRTDRQQPTGLGLTRQADVSLVCQRTRRRPRAHAKSGR